MNEDKKVNLEDIVGLAKRRGFIFPGSEIYGGMAGVYDYGPLGVLLKENIKESWRKHFVLSRSNVYMVDTAILMQGKVWETTGHVAGFNDPLVEDLKTNKRYRADHLLEEAGVKTDGLSVEQMSQLIKESSIKSPNGNELGEVRDFNMMLKTEVGADLASAVTSYLRPETAQGIFVNFKNVVDTFHPNLPFGIAQIGKAFRNEITPRNFVFRQREFEQMEIEYFVRPNEWEGIFNETLSEMRKWMDNIGIDMNLVSEREIEENERAHYSKRTVDFEFEYPFGKKELYGLAYRTDYDLSKHAEVTKQKIGYIDQSSGEYFYPHVIEPSFGLDRTVLALLLSAYKVDVIGDDERVYLDLKPEMAPYKMCVSPLLKNKSELQDKAKEVFWELKREFGNVVFDDNGNIGKRYRRQDEIGTAFCLVVDFDTLEDGTVSIRDRNTTEQVRVSLQSLVDDLKIRLSS